MEPDVISAIHHHSLSTCPLIPSYTGAGATDKTEQDMCSSYSMCLVGQFGEHRCYCPRWKPSWAVRSKAVEKALCSVSYGKTSKQNERWPFQSSFSSVSTWKGPFWHLPWRKRPGRKRPGRNKCFSLNGLFGRSLWRKCKRKEGIIFIIFEFQDPMSDYLESNKQKEKVSEAGKLSKKSRSIPPSFIKGVFCHKP